MAELVTRNPSALWRATLGRVVVVAPGQAEARVLQPPGGVIWGLLEDAVTVDEVVTRIGTSFSLPEDTVRRDVESFVQALLADGLALHVDAVSRP